MSRHHVPTFTAAVALVFAPGSVSTQQPTARTPQRVQATIAMVDSLPVPGAPFVVQRRPDRTPADLVLVRTTASSAELSNAVRTLVAARAAGGDYPVVSGIVRMRPHQQSRGVPKQLPWAAGVLRRLRSANPDTIDGIGVVRSVVIWLPKQGRSRGGIGVPNKP